MAQRPRRRRGRQPRSYERRAPMREPYDVVLIVCEGAKTEPAYFIRLREIYRLASTNVYVTPANGTDPMSVFTFAEDKLDDFDRIYCVFDRDSHENYDAALVRVAELKAKGNADVIAITSWPCFATSISDASMYWLTTPACHRCTNPSAPSRGSCGTR